MTILDNKIDEILTGFETWDRCGRKDCEHNRSYQLAKQAINQLILDELKKAWNATQPDIVPEGWEPSPEGKYLEKRIKELE